MTRTILIIVLFALALTACNDPLGATTRAQIEADAAVEMARITSETAALEAAAAVTMLLIFMAAVVVIAGIGALAMIKLNQDNLMADAMRTLPPVQRATPLPAGRPASRRPALMQRHTLALPMPTERDADKVIVIDG